MPNGQTAAVVCTRCDASDEKRWQWPYASAFNMCHERLQKATWTLPLRKGQYDELQQSAHQARYGTSSSAAVRSVLRNSSAVSAMVTSSAAVGFEKPNLEMPPG